MALEKLLLSLKIGEEVHSENLRGITVTQFLIDGSDFLEIITVQFEISSEVFFDAMRGLALRNTGSAEERQKYALDVHTLFAISILYCTFHEQRPKRVPPGHHSYRISWQSPGEWGLQSIYQHVDAWCLLEHEQLFRSAKVKMHIQ